LKAFENIRGLELFEIYNSAVVLMQGLFVVEVLQLKETHPKMARIIRWLLISRVLVTLIFILFWVFWWSIMVYHVAFIAIMAGCSLFLLKRNKGFYRYILVGNITIVTALIAVFVIRFLDVHDILPNWFSADRRGAPFHIMQVALFVDMVFYFAGLAFRDKQMEKDKLSFQQQYGESELKALRSQMNPHFIFNVLNTIESYTLQHNKEAASAAIQKFSRLTRIVLENSRNPLVSFDQDLYALKLYVELEQLRYGKKFTTTYNIDETLLNGNYAVPPMIIQPFVENAIIHGLRNKKNGKGRLVISATSEMNGLLVVITDNGIGRKEAGNFKSASGMFRESLGIRFTQDRIAMYNSTTGKKSIAEIVDLEEGTQVSILFPQGS
jgi:sensor histidine kinase YesM